VTLCDTGPLVALFVQNDQHHASSHQALKTQVTLPLLTTWLCVAEVMHFLGRAVGPLAQDDFWDWVAHGVVTIHPPGADDWKRIRELMARYADLPMAVADASLVVTAEQTRMRRVFTFDRHFRTYLINDRDPFDVVP
jgi:predicted nucleic acid-binding protein